MIPAQYDIEIYRGDTYHGPLITLPDLTPFGGPPDLGGSVEVSAQLRTPGTSGLLLGDFDVDVVDPTLRQVRLSMSPATTAAIAKPVAVWDLEVADGAWVGTPLAGGVEISGEVTKDA